MATVKVVIRKKPNAQGLYPITVRITKNRKSSFCYTGQYIALKHWDEKHQRVKKSHPNSTRLNTLLLKKLSEVNKQLLNDELEDKDGTAQDVRKSVLEQKTKHSFFVEAQKYMDILRAEGKYNQYTTNKPRIERFREFLKDKDIKFQEITVSLLLQFKAYLKGHYKVSERTAVNTLILIRTIYNRGIKSGIVDQKHYPFGRNKIVIKFPDTEKLGLSKEEVALLEAVNLSDNPKMHHARNLWLFSFYFAGMRVSDVLKLRWRDFLEGRLFYQMGKNDKAGSLKIPDKAQAILEQYIGEQSSRDDLIFPELRVVDDFSDIYLVQRKTSYAVKNINKYLKRLASKLGIQKKMTMHVARHTFGNISGDRIPIQMLQKLYRHSDITTTINYQKAFIYKDADDALDAVLNS